MMVSGTPLTCVDKNVVVNSSGVLEDVLEEEVVSVSTGALGELTAHKSSSSSEWRERERTLTN